MFTVHIKQQCQKQLTLATVLLQDRMEAAATPDAADSARALVPVSIVRALLPSASKPQRELVRSLLATLA